MCGSSWSLVSNPLLSRLKLIENWNFTALPTVPGNTSILRSGRRESRMSILFLVVGVVVLCLLICGLVVLLKKSR